MVKYAVAALGFYVGSVAAQAPTAPQADPKAATTTHSTAPGQRSPTPSRDQFFSPVMGINIEGQGLSLPKGVAEEEPITKPPAEQPAAPAPASTPK